MDVIEVMFTTWVGWPIYTALAMLLGTALWEHLDERARARPFTSKLKLDMKSVNKRIR
jgi:hypothetical protein